MSKWLTQKEIKKAEKDLNKLYKLMEGETSSHGMAWIFSMK